MSQIDTLTLAWATHRLSGISTPANAAYSVDELIHQLTSSGSKVLFTCCPLLPTALEAASKSGIPKDRIYLLGLPTAMTCGKGPPKEFKTVDDLIQEGAKQSRLEDLNWEKGQGARQTAFLCYSSGTSGLPVSFPPWSGCSFLNLDKQCTERSHDLTPQRHCQCPANPVLR